MNETGNNNENSIQQFDGNVNDKKTGENERKLFTEGGIGGPGRPKDTEEDKLKKKAIKKIIADYERSLADILPELPGILKKKALYDEDIQAIKEKLGNEHLLVIYIF